MESKSEEYKRILEKNQRQVFLLLVLQINLAITITFSVYYYFLFDILWTDERKEILILSMIMTITIILQFQISKRVTKHYTYKLKAREEMISDFQLILEGIDDPIVMDEIIRLCENFDKDVFKFMYTPKIKRR